MSRSADLQYAHRVRFVMAPSRHDRNAFTLIELLVALGIVSLLFSILLPAMAAGRHAARDVQCRTQLRSVCQEFTFFADDGYSGSRGDSDRNRGNRFRLEDFQESIYGISEFWDRPRLSRDVIDGKGKLLLCPASTYRLERRARVPCNGGAVGPQQNVSVGFNRRLDTRSRVVGGRPVPATAFVTPRILQYPDVPLLIDVDGAMAASNRQLPYYTAPPITDDSETDIYETGGFWHPSFRHRARVNVGFVGGHVLSSAHPTAEPWCRWRYQPDP